MNYIWISIRFIILRAESGKLVAWRYAPVTLLLTFAVWIPLSVVSKANIFHTDGFIDKVAGFLSVLTGFYVAGLVAVASFASQPEGVDAEMRYGRIRHPSLDGVYLNRREYVCSMFGFLSILSLAITLTALVVVTIGDALSLPTHVTMQLSTCTLNFPGDVIRSIALFPIVLVVSLLATVTSHGLYYFTDRIYYVEPTIPPKTPPDKV